MDAQAKAQGCSENDQTHNAPDSFESLYVGVTVPDAPELVQQANPKTYITPDDPPFLIQKGETDCTVPVENTKMLADALEAAGLEVEYDLLAGVGHGDVAPEEKVFQSEQNIQRILAFLDRYLK